MAQSMQILSKSLIFLIKLYRYLISPLLGSRCRFHPSCSEYAQTAIEHCGCVRGIFLSLKRLLCCHPWHPGGYDPVPTEKIKS
jgi:putative membrane protein insertion efficiency factor